MKFSHGDALTAGSSNTILDVPNGYDAIVTYLFISNTTGSSNTAIGYQSGLNITTGSNNTIITSRTGGTGDITLNRLIISKEILANSINVNHPLTLTGTTYGSIKALELVTGRLELNDSNININLSSGGADFNISQSTALVLQSGSSVNVTGTNTGISLDGLLSVEDNSQVILGDGTTTDNRYIEYSASGNAVLELHDDAALQVNSQIRRSLFQTSGVLKYRQYDNSNVIIYGQDHDATRAKLEIENTGSEFTMSGGSLTIVRGGGTTFGDLYMKWSGNDNLSA